jgi:hypothetical protein
MKYTPTYNLPSSTTQSNMSLTDIIFEFIDTKKEYARGKYGEFEVIIMKKNGYVNATKLCKEKGKRFDHWLENKSSKELVSEVKKSSPGIPGDAIIKITGGNILEVRGTYVHPDLVPHIASWISPVFALKVSKIVNEYIIQEYKYTLSKQEKEILIQKGIIEKKKGKITTLMEKLDKISEQNEKILKKNDNLKTMVSGLQIQNDGLADKLDDAHDKLDTTKNELSNVQYKLDDAHGKLGDAQEKLDDMQDKLDNVQNKLQSVQEKLGIAESNLALTKNKLITTKTKLCTTLYHKNIPPTDDALTHKFAILKFNDKNHPYNYHVMRIQKRSYEKTLKSYKTSHPKCETILELEYSPNSISLWNRVTEKISHHFKIRNANDFSLKKNFSENEMIAKIRDIHNSRYNTE